MKKYSTWDFRCIRCRFGWWEAHTRVSQRTFCLSLRRYFGIRLCIKRYCLRKKKKPPYNFSVWVADFLLQTDFFLRRFPCRRAINDSNSIHWRVDWRIHRMKRLIFSGTSLEVSTQAIEKMICCRSLKLCKEDRYTMIWLKWHLHPGMVKKPLNANRGITFVFLSSSTFSLTLNKAEIMPSVEGEISIMPLILYCLPSCESFCLAICH